MKKLFYLLICSLAFVNVAKASLSEEAETITEMGYYHLTNDQIPNNDEILNRLTKIVESLSTSGLDSQTYNLVSCKWGGAHPLLSTTHKLDDQHNLNISYAQGFSVIKTEAAAENTMLETQDDLNAFFKALNILRLKEMGLTPNNIL